MTGTLYPKRMETVDDEILDLSLKFVDKARKDGKPFFLWLNPTRMHVTTHLSPKYEAMRNSTSGNARCNVSRVPALRKNSFQHMPPSTTLSTSNAISRQLNHAACYAPRR